MAAYSVTETPQSSDFETFALLARLVRGEVPANDVAHVELTWAVAIIAGIHEEFTAAGKTWADGQRGEADPQILEAINAVMAAGGDALRSLELMRCFSSPHGAPWFATLLLRDYPDQKDLARKFLYKGTIEAFALLVEKTMGPAARYTLARIALLAAKEDAAELDAHALELASALEKHARNLRERLAAVPSEARILDGSVPLWLDVTLARYFDELGGETAKAAAEKVRTHDTTRGEPLEWLRPWRPDPLNGHPLICSAFELLATVVWHDEVRPALAAPRHRVEAVSVAGDHYAKMPKPISPVSWAFGAPGIEVDGNRYAEAPTLAKVMIPRTWALLPADHAKRPHQTAFPLEINEAEALPVMMAEAQGYVITPLAAKLALVMLASEGVCSGQRYAVDLETLTRWVRPGAPRLQPREYKATAEALEELSRLWLYLPDHTRVQLFTFRLPWTPNDARADMTLRFGLSPELCEVLAHGVRGPSLRGNEYNGRFLINLTGAMRLPNKEPQLLRYKIRAAADWNNACSAGPFDKERVRAYTLEQWAGLANALPHGVAEYLIAKKGRRAASAAERKALSDARKKVAEHLERLDTEFQLAKFDRVGRDRFRLLPTSEYLEARDKARARGGGFRAVEPPTFSTRKPGRKPTRKGAK